MASFQRNLGFVHVVFTQLSQVDTTTDLFNAIYSLAVQIQNTMNQRKEVWDSGIR